MSGIPWSVGKITTNPRFKNTFKVLQKHSKIGNTMERNRSVTAAEIRFFLYFLCIIRFEYFFPLNPSLSVPLLEEPGFHRSTLSSSSSTRKSPPPVKCDPISCRGGKKDGETQEGWERQKGCWGKNGYPLVCVQDSPHVAVLSLQQRPSVAFCVAQWLLNTRPSHRITPASESLQTNTPTRIFDSRKTSCLALLTSPPPIPFPPFHFDGWWRVQSCGPPVLSWCEPKPIWGSISCLPALSTLKTTTILSWGRKFRTHYSLFRSRPRSKSSPPASICCVVYRVKSAAFAFSLCPIYTCSYVSCLFLKLLWQSTGECRLEKHWAAGICYSL